MSGFMPYVWRDPARVSPGRLAELAEHDRRLELLQAAWTAEVRDRQRAGHWGRDGRPAEAMAGGQCGEGHVLAAPAGDPEADDEQEPG
jgi:hypothetical protein